MKTVVTFLENTRLDQKQVHRNLTLFPLLGREGLKPYYLTLEQAMEGGCIEITEVDASGSVNDLSLTVTGRRPVLLVEGEELKGAKQNRLINATFLIAGGTRTKIPVSCVEEGRWRYSSPAFSSGKKMMNASLRRETQHSVKANLAHGGGHRSDQGRIWNNIAETSTRFNVASPTMAMADVFDGNEERLARCTDSFHPLEGQTGALFAIDGRIAGLECFASGDTFARFFDKLVRSYALDALDRTDRGDKAPAVAPAKARAFLASAVKSKGQRHRAVGLGETIAFESRIVSGAALADGERVLHLSAFRRDAGRSGSRVGYQRFSYRRR